MHLYSLTTAWSPRLLSLLRIMAGLLVLQFGTAKLLGFPMVPAFSHVPVFSLEGASGIIELSCGALVVVGLFAQPAAFILSGEMAFAYFLQHFPRGFFPLLNGGTLAVMFCFVFLYLAASGPGPLSLDAKVRGLKLGRPDGVVQGHG
jgi:putative oxidoreductase